MVTYQSIDPQSLARDEPQNALKTFPCINCPCFKLILYESLLHRIQITMIAQTKKHHDLSTSNHHISCNFSLIFSRSQIHVSRCMTEKERKYQHGFSARNVGTPVSKAAFKINFKDVFSVSRLVLFCFKIMSYYKIKIINHTHHAER